MPLFPLEDNDWFVLLFLQLPKWKVINWLGVAHFHKGPIDGGEALSSLARHQGLRTEVELGLSFL